MDTEVGFPEQGPALPPDSGRDRVARWLRGRRKRRLPRFRFGLRTLLLFVVLVASICALLGTKLQQAREQRRVLSKILSEGGLARCYDSDSKQELWSFELPPPGKLDQLIGVDLSVDVLGIGVRNPAFGDRDLAALRAFPNLTRLDLRGTAVTDAGILEIPRPGQLKALRLGDTQVGDCALAQIKEMAQLQHLCLENTAVTDGGVRELLQLPELEVLYLSGTHITDGAVPYVRRMADLKYLFLANTAVSDRGTPELATMRRLELLDLSGTQITDASVESLMRMTNLQFLLLDNTDMSDVAIEKLSDALQDCAVRRLRDSEQTQSLLEDPP